MLSACAVGVFRVLPAPGSAVVFFGLLLLHKVLLSYEDPSVLDSPMLLESVSSILLESVSSILLVSVSEILTPVLFDFSQDLSPSERLE